MSNQLSVDVNGFKSHYEELEKKKVVKKVQSNKVQPKVAKKPKVSFKNRVKKLTEVIRKPFNNVVNKVNPRRKKAKKLTKLQKKLNREQQMRGILGIGLLFVIVSIAYSTYVIFNGVHSTASRVMLVPQVVFAVLTLFKAFSKIYK